MKKLATLIILFTLFGIQAYAQLVPVAPGTFENYWNISVFKKDGSSYSPYSGSGVEVSIQYKDINDELIYSEQHIEILNSNSSVRLLLGKGNNPFPPVLTQEDFKRITSFCWTVLINTDHGQETVSGMELVKPNMFSYFSNVSLDSENFSGNSFSTVAKEPVDVFKAGTGLNLLLQGTNNEVPPKSMICPFPMDVMLHYGSAPSVVTGEQVNMAAFGTGLHCPLSFGNVIPSEAVNFYSATIPNLAQFRNGVGIGVTPDPDATHATNGLYVENKSKSGIGARMEGTTLGTYGIGNTGMTGLGYGTATVTTGVYGLPFQEPPIGGVSYGVAGNAQNFANTYAGFFNGNVLVNGTVTMGSDARLKTEIRSQSNALENIMRLRPAIYNYRQDTPYGLPDELSHGFIAQELEEVFPELVKTMRLPLNLDPEKMSTSGTVDYKGINYTGMIAILTSALQELNTTLTAKIETQAAEIAHLKKLLEH